ncbi:MAG: endonuclease/exonuclease/phosphatase family protein [Deltaproteobacteria bacterium]
MKIIITIIAIVFISATALPLIRYEDWWIRIFDFPRTQIAVGGLIIMFIYLLVYNKTNFAENIIFIILIICVAYQLYRMYPYTPVASIQVLNNEENDPEKRLKVLVANIYMKNRDSGKFIEQIRNTDPDIVCVLEPDEWWDSELEIFQDSYPYSKKHISDDTYGMIFYSKLKPVLSEVNYLVEDYIPSVHSILELKSGDLIEFYCVHPNPPNPKYADDTVERDAELLIVGKKAKESDMPTVVAGDLNDVAWSYTTGLFQKISGLLDPRIGRGFYNTFHVKYPIIRFPLDHIFVSDSFRVVELRKLPDVGSDHFPILAEFSYEPHNKDEQQKNKPEADHEDRKEAEEKIEEAK